MRKGTKGKHEDQDPKMRRQKNVHAVMCRITSFQFLHQVTTSGDTVCGCSLVVGETTVSPSHLLISSHGTVSYHHVYPVQAQPGGCSA